VFGISGFELLIILVFVLIIFGPDKLPQLAKTVGSAMRMFKSAQADMEKVIKAEMLTGDSTSKLDIGNIFNPTSSAASTPEAAEPTQSASTSAATVWAATSEDDEEEEDEE